MVEQAAAVALSFKLSFSNSALLVSLFSTRSLLEMHSIGIANLRISARANPLFAASNHLLNASLSTVVISDA